ncbi:glutamate receptor ionotropic, delta-2-like [Macrobrachium nipponense]|uniref:glutamate receptor ionotropic, delta-2-like n=1 Tax=Macrobrachium nipponense TaxID=159736 RepID=UPI0030C84A4C
MYNKMDSSRMYSLSDHCFSVYRSLVVQGNEMRLRGWCQKCLYLGWFLFCFIIYALYSGTLTAVLAVPAFEKPIDSLTDLLDAVIKDGFKPVVVRGTSNEFIFSDATSGIYKQLWDVFDPKDRYVYSWDEGIDKVISGKYVFANAYLGAVIRAKSRGLHKYHFAKNTFYPQSYGMACANGAPYKTLFDSLLIQITSAGLVQKWTKDEVSKVKSADSSSSSGPGAITLVQLQAAFFILLIGYFLATIALIVEAIIGVCSKSKTSAKENAL